MPDREKVINRIETICNICKENTWRTEFSSDTIYPLLRDALALLKEQEAVKPSILDYPSGRRRAWCGKCGYRVKIGYHGDCTENFCGKCGTSVNWEGR